ncbi:GNAT family N-acetyltransferase [Enterococcus sp. LJL51]|uniref:GNAT family N-acetyltransferase n=1 Tax=Enterococcus sp. LJL51 TaxID=3416656 RepID=UPI003CE9AF0B
MIFTKRTTLRPFDSLDLADLYAYSRISGLGEQAGWKYHESLSEAERMLWRFLKSGFTFAIVLNESTKVIGHITAHEDSVDGRTDTKELGFVLHPGYQGQGIMAEVIENFLPYLFNQGIVKIYACCFQVNRPSKKLIEKCGFQFDQEGEFVSKSLNQTFPSYEYLLTKAEWEARR